jgi:hypothetical protein
MMQNSNFGSISNLGGSSKIVKHERDKRFSSELGFAGDFERRVGFDRFDDCGPNRAKAFVRKRRAQLELFGKTTALRNRVATAVRSNNEDVARSAPRRSVDQLRAFGDGDIAGI